MLFVESDVEVLLEKCSQAERLDSEELRGNPRVEDFGDMPAIILMEKAQIVVGIVKDDFHGTTLEQLTKLCRRADRKGVDDRASVSRRQLKEINAVEESMKARAFRVDRELGG